MPSPAPRISLGKPVETALGLRSIAESSGLYHCGRAEIFATVCVPAISSRRAWQTDKPRFVCLQCQHCPEQPFVAVLSDAELSEHPAVLPDKQIQVRTPENRLGRWPKHATR